ncbi:hypothetical protein SynRS9907_00670 [Synechococcus sp. RS9907]|nr:hypothetical protein SynRS9907_00670 [Synechococcus sp. RS9907]
MIFVSNYFFTFLLSSLKGLVEFIFSNSCSLGCDNLSSAARF